MADTVQIVTTENGPYQVEGTFQISDHDGRAVEAPNHDAVYLCRRGQSDSKPFCDGTHATVDCDGTLAN